MLNVVVECSLGFRSLVPADPDAVTGRQESRSHITAEVNLRLRVIDMEVRGGVQIVRRDQFEIVTADNHDAALIRGADQFGVQRSVVPDEAFPQAGYVPLHLLVARVPQGKAGRNIRILVGNERLDDGRRRHDLGYSREHLREDLETARVQNGALPVGLDDIHVRIDDPALVLVIQHPPAVIPRLKYWRCFHAVPPLIQRDISRSHL